VTLRQLGPLWLCLCLCAGCVSLPPGTASAPLPVPATPARLPDPARIPDESRLPDAVPRVEARSIHGNPPSYEVFGQRYVVLATAAGFTERGVASWYGPDFHGKNTSSGEAYDMYGMTAAHKTLPIPCYVRVTNLSNQRSVIVRVNDRGPFVANRIIDLSYTAAARLDMLRDGTAFVELAVLTPGENSAAWPLGVQAAELPAPPAASSGLYAQVGAFASRDNALHLQSQLRSAGIANVVLAEAATGAAVTRVRIGPLASVGDFDSLVTRLNVIGIRAVQLVHD
jgi:rare lipoprotein A